MDGPHTVGASFGPLNVAFISSTQMPSLNLGATPDAALIAADAFCNQKANGKLTGRFVAWLSTGAAGGVSGVDAAKRLVVGGDPTKPARGWIRPDGQPFADSTISLTQANQLFHPLVVDENIATVGYATVGTGTGAAGTLAAGNCQNWSSTANTDQFMAGTDQSVGDGDWTATVLLPCNSVPPRVYCFQVDYGNALIVTPPTQKRWAFLTKAPFPDASAGVAAADQQCANEAATAGLAGSFKAALGVTGSSAASRFDLTAAPWVRSDGILVDTTAAGLFQNTTHLTGLNVAADGKTYCMPGATEIAGCDAWIGGAGPTMAGTDANTCKNWTFNQTSTTYEVLIGDSSTQANQLFNNGISSGCNLTNLRLYCLQE